MRLPGAHSTPGIRLTHPQPGLVGAVGPPNFSSGEHAICLISECQ